MKKKEYKRNADNVGKYILKVLQTLGGSASRQSIKEGIVDDEESIYHTRMCLNL